LEDILSSITSPVLFFPPRWQIQNIYRRIFITDCISAGGYFTISSVGAKTKKDDDAKEQDAPWISAPWVHALERFRQAEPRVDPRPKPGQKAHLKIWNWTDLAAATGMTANGIGEIRRGIRRPEPDTLDRLALALNRPVYMFLMPPDVLDRFMRFEAQESADSAVKQREEQQRLVEQFAEFVKSRGVTLTPPPAPAPLTVVPQPQRMTGTSRKRR
jgi:transcriptional regulator with XRE-family HTH domain